MWKRFAADYLTFSKKERTGVLTLLVLIALLIAIPFLFPLFIKKKTYSHDAFEKEIAALTIQQTDSTGRYARKDFNDDRPSYFEPPEKADSYTTSELFYFDPNTLNAAGWQRLGVRDKTIATIKNYLSKGGKFYKPGDIKKIWGMNEALADKLIPYIRIESDKEGRIITERAFDNNKPAYEKKTYHPSVIEVNTADTSAFIALPGIGSKLASRIVTFREKLGGFYKIEQVGETFGLPDSTFQKIKDRLALNIAVIKKININTASVDELKVHPYIRYNIANAIVQYRNQHGNFSSVDDLKKIAAVSEDIFSRASPYLVIN